jgi:tripeptide aminopeptidase
MKEVILPHMHLIKTAEEAAAEAGIVPRCEPIRGGTDGARLSFMGLPCPNLGTGGYAFHGPFEHISAEGMHAAVNMILGIVTKYASKKRQELIG